MGVGVNFALLSLLMSLTVAALTTWTGLGGSWLRSTSVTLLLAWPALLVLGIWGATGAWRCATAHVDRGGRRAWARASQLVVVLGAAAMLAVAATHFVPRIGGYVQLARGIDPGGHVRASVAADGRRLRLEGPLGAGDAARVQQLLASAPRAWLLELDMPGGRLHEALELAETLRASAWLTRVTGRCDNACALVFMAGERRQLMPQAQLGFHRAAVGTFFNPVFERLANRELARQYRRAGLPEIVVTKILATPPSRLWHPDRYELASHGLLSAPARPLDVDLPPPEGARPGDYADALSTNPIWHTLERRFPGSIGAAAERMVSARAAGAPDEAVLVAGQRVVEARMAELLFNAGPELREQFVVLLADQLAAARLAGPGACRGVLAGDAQARRSLPAELAAREAAWLTDAAVERARQTPARVPTAPELAVVRHLFGAHAPERLAGLRDPTAAEARDCERSSALLRAILQLGAAERRLAIRFIVE